MKNKARSIFAMGLAVAVLSMTACSGAAPTAAPTTDKKADGTSAPVAETKAPASGDATTLRVMWWGAENRHTATKAALDEYTKQNPTIKFDAEPLSWDGYWQKLGVLAASNTIPDIFQMDAAFIDQYVMKHQLADLTSIDISSVVPENIMNNIKIDGKVYGLPTGRNGAGMVFNKTGLEAAGIKLPASGWTWDDFWAYLEEARTKLPKDSYPFVDMSIAWDNYQLYQASMGKGRMIEKDGHLNLDKESFTTFMGKMDDFRKKGVIPPIELTSSFLEGDAVNDGLVNGKVMARTATVGSVGSVFDLMPEKELGVVNWPMGSAGSGWAQSTIFFSIAENSQHKPEAMAFEKWFTIDPKAGEILGTSRGIPLSDEVFKNLSATLKPKDLLGKSMLDVAMANKPMPFYPAHPAYTEFSNTLNGTFRGVMEEVAFGKLTVDQAYDKLVETGKEIEAGIATAK